LRHGTEFEPQGKMLSLALVIMAETGTYTVEKRLNWIPGGAYKVSGAYILTGPPGGESHNLQDVLTGETAPPVTHEAHEIRVLIFVLNGIVGSNLDNLL
jgi:hypothetical protein